VENFCERGNELSGSIKCWESTIVCKTGGFWSGTQLHRVSYRKELLSVEQLPSNSSGIHTQTCSYQVSQVVGSGIRQLMRGGGGIQRQEEDGINLLQENTLTT
jgi:hypothetical protein